MDTSSTTAPKRTGTKFFGSVSQKDCKNILKSSVQVEVDGVKTGQTPWMSQDVLGKMHNQVMDKLDSIIETIKSRIPEGVKSLNPQLVSPILGYEPVPPKRRPRKPKVAAEGDEPMIGGDLEAEGMSEEICDAA